MQPGMRTYQFSIDVSLDVSLFEADAPLLPPISSSVHLEPEQIHHSL